MYLPAKLISIAENVRKLQVDITCIQEVNDTLPWHNRKKITRALSRCGKRANLTIATLKPHHNRTTYQPGGNLVALSTQSHRKLPSNSDPHNMGRWAVATLNYPKSKVTGSGKLHVFSIYRDTAVHSGENASLTQ